MKEDLPFKLLESRSIYIRVKIIDGELCNVGSACKTINVVHIYRHYLYERMVPNGYGQAYVPTSPDKTLVAGRAAKGGKIL